MKIKDIKTKEQADEYLKSIGYGEKRDYRKIYVNGMATNWAKSLDVAKIAWFAQYNQWPWAVEYAA